MDRKRSKKSDVIQYALEQNGITDLAHTIMIGDREHDVLGAQAQKLDSIGVLYGFGSREELEEAGVIGPAEGTKPRKVLMTQE